jgi:putative membrane protein
VLREYLAIERTRLANETTLLAYIRTGLYFLVAGSTLGHLLTTQFWKILGTPLILVGLAIMILGIVRYIRLRKSIESSRSNVGNSSEEFIRSIKGTKEIPN